MQFIKHIKNKYAKKIIIYFSSCLILYYLPYVFSKYLNSYIDTTDVLWILLWIPYMSGYFLFSLIRKIDLFQAIIIFWTLFFLCLYIFWIYSCHNYIVEQDTIINIISLLLVFTQIATTLSLFILFNEYTQKHPELTNPIIKKK